MPTSGWETIILWAGILALTLMGGIHAHRNPPAAPEPRPQNTQPIIWSGLVMPGLIVLLLLVLLADLRALVVGSVLMTLLLLGSVAVFGGPKR